MTKKELITKLSARTQLNMSSCDALLNALILEIEDAVCSGDEISLHGIGKWTVKSRKERMVRNPRTGELIFVSARQAVTFKTSKRLNDYVNSYSDDIGAAVDKQLIG